MPVTHVSHDNESHTLTFIAEFAAPRERLWQIYADPRQLEKIWGPPSYPATFVDHDLSPGGRVTYYMTGQEGARHAGYWEITEVDEPNSFTFIDGFADENLNPVSTLPVSTNRFSFEQRGAQTVLTFHSTYASVADLQQVLDMGVVEGATSAINQIDEFIAS
ncbi:SRPBCC family protein [Pseudomonas sp. TTU2014-080ASC]|uniref:SRPBCC family protein n=1 Tax=Pseudomonas sp. TTU2014-080ASC TaxID=1729724 RepID=UPI0007186039|nr:SRPBCC domain-containing protein [Pseudomonas sp. TTU2014-080ASC]KRW59746.1 polyketide cyclase [Pseudomonas sp. TTU2014-080ASC]